MHPKTLENMDGHLALPSEYRGMWMVTRYFPDQGHRYDERGWPTWERAVAQLLTIVLFDLSKIVKAILQSI